MKPANKVRPNPQRLIFARTDSSFMRPLRPNATDVASEERQRSMEGPAYSSYSLESGLPARRYPRQRNRKVPHCRERSDLECAGRSGGYSRALLSFEAQLLVGRRARHVGNEPNGRLRDAGAVAGDVGQLEERRVHHLVVDELLGLVKKLLALAAVDLHRLSLHEILDVRIRPIGEEAARRHERVEPGGRVTEGGGRALDDLLEPLVAVLLE